MRRLFLGMASYFLLCVGFAFANQAMVLPVDTTPLTVATSKGKISYDVEIAKTPEQSEAGLMYRTDFPKNRAMLFSFPTKQIIYMWMANTPLPLDMVFLDENGFVVSIVENATPFSTNIISSRLPVAFTIELNSGEVIDKKIEVGQQFFHPEICAQCQPTL